MDNIAPLPLPWYLRLSAISHPRSPGLTVRSPTGGCSAHANGEMDLERYDWINLVLFNLVRKALPVRTYVRACERQSSADADSFNALTVVVAGSRDTHGKCEFRTVESIDFRLYWVFYESKSPTKDFAKPDSPLYPSIRGMRVCRSHPRLVTICR